jgi:DnaJ-class molecular chaperone
MNFYETLGVAKSATADEIKAAYRRLAQKHHPDKGGDQVKMQEIQRAYDVLSDPEKRARHDAGENTDGPSLEDQRAIVLAQMFMTLLDQTGDSTDIIADMKLFYVRQKANIELDIINTRRAITKREKAVKRITRKAGENFIAAKLRTDIELKQDQIGKAQAMIVEADNLIAMLNGFVFEPDAPPSPYAQAGITSATLQSLGFTK